MWWALFLQPAVVSVVIAALPPTGVGVVAGLLRAPPRSRLRRGFTGRLRISRGLDSSLAANRRNLRRLASLRGLGFLAGRDDLTWLRIGSGGLLAYLGRGFPGDGAAICAAFRADLRDQGWGRHPLGSLGPDDLANYPGDASHLASRITVEVGGPDPHEAPPGAFDLAGAQAIP